MQPSVSLLTRCAIQRHVGGVMLFDMRTEGRILNVVNRRRWIGVHCDAVGGDYREACIAQNQAGKVIDVVIEMLGNTDKVEV